MNEKEATGRRTRKKKGGATGLDLVVLNTVKDSFLNLCRQYSLLGKLKKVHAQAISHPAFAKTDVRGSFERILEQYREIGEQLKVIGEGIDDLGGKAMMYPSTPNPVLKKSSSTDTPIEPESSPPSESDQK